MNYKLLLHSELTIKILLQELLIYLFQPYVEYTTLQITLEIIATICGISSVYFSWKNKLWVFPTGIISTLIYVYLLIKFNLLGDVVINSYYFVMSIYGWYHWSNGKMDENQLKISHLESKNIPKAIAIFISSFLFILVLYWIKANQNEDNLGISAFFLEKIEWVNWVDSLTTAISFVGMWLMARKKIEHWYFWIVGDLISIPMYIYKGLTITSFQFMIFVIFAVLGLFAWNKLIREENALS